jgi:hypothetical protein
VEVAVQCGTALVLTWAVKKRRTDDASPTARSFGGAGRGVSAGAIRNLGKLWNSFFSFFANFAQVFTQSPSIQ